MKDGFIGGDYDWLIGCCWVEEVNMKLLCVEYLGEVFVEGRGESSIIGVGRLWGWIGWFFVGGCIKVWICVVGYEICF